tara:strand:- start:1889 stop:2023 length:135 start_codon:yes stop_codon:yes gene_type:complete
MTKSLADFNDKISSNPVPQNSQADNMKANLKNEVVVMVKKEVEN